MAFLKQTQEEKKKKEPTTINLQPYTNKIFSVPP